MPVVKLAPIARKQYLDSNGDPVVGGKLFTYAAGSSTKQATYTDNTGTTANTNPIILDSAGRTPYGVWYESGLIYKEVLALSTDTDPPTSPIYTADVLVGVNDTTTAAALAASSQWVATGLTPTYVSATQFTLVGDQTAAFHVGRRLRLTVTAGTVYGRISVTAFTTLTTVTVVLDSGSLDSGLSAVDVGILTALNNSLPEPSSVGIQPLDAQLTTLSGITAQQATDLAALSTFMGTLLNDSDQATALATLGALLNGSVAKTATYKVVAADRGKLIDCSGTWTLDVDAAATLGAGFAFAVKNSGTGTITIDPNLSETVDGVATLAIGPGESGFVVCTGTEWRTVGRTFITYRTANTGMPSAGSANSAGHPLARIPDNARIELLCVISERGFGVGTVVEATGEWSGTGSASPIEVWKTSTSVGFNFSSGENFFLRDVSTGAAFIPTAANWVYRFVLD